MGEFGVVVAQGRERFEKELPLILANLDNGLPTLARETFTELAARLWALNERISGYDRHLQHRAQESESARRLMAVEGVGPVTATAVVATVGDAHEFSTCLLYTSRCV